MHCLSLTKLMYSEDEPGATCAGTSTGSSNSIYTFISGTRHANASACWHGKQNVFVDDRTVRHMSAYGGISNSPLKEELNTLCPSVARSALCPHIDLTVQ